MLNELIASINSSLKSDLGYSDARYLGVSEIIPQAGVDDQPVVMMPCIVDEYGDATPISPDTDYALQVYHRVNSKSSELRSVQYGSRNKEQMDVYSMTMFVIGSRKKIKKSGFCLGEEIADWFPDILTYDGVNIPVNQQEMNYDSAAIMNAEFPEIEYSGIPELFMLSLTYSVRFSFRKRCRTNACNAGHFNRDHFNQGFNQ